MSVAEVILANHRARMQRDAMKQARMRAGFQSITTALQAYAEKKRKEQEKADKESQDRRGEQVALALQAVKMGSDVSAESFPDLKPGEITFFNALSKRAREMADPNAQMDEMEKKKRALLTKILSGQASPQEIAQARTGGLIPQGPRPEKPMDPLDRLQKLADLRKTAAETRKMETAPEKDPFAVPMKLLDIQTKAENLKRLREGKEPALPSAVQVYLWAAGGDEAKAREWFAEDRKNAKKGNGEGGENATATSVFTGAMRAFEAVTNGDLALDPQAMDAIKRIISTEFIRRGDELKKKYPAVYQAVGGE